ncbi:MAG: M67 family metallopeptidase [Prochlorococcus sp.]
MPGLLEFDGDCLMVLRRSLLALAPQEGCALLLGEQAQAVASPNISHWRVRLIWPCCNIWSPGMASLSEASVVSDCARKPVPSRHSRFALDPLEQIQAQRWARERNWRVLGSAHSHPCGDAVPSSLDKRWAVASSLMVIVNGSDCVRAWWMAADHPAEPCEVTCLGDC